MTRLQLFIFALAVLLLGCSAEASQELAVETPTVPAGADESSPEPVGREPTDADTRDAPVNDARVPRGDPACLGAFSEQEFEAIVFLNPEVQDAGIDRVTDIVTSWRVVTSVSFVSQQEAYEEFQAMFDGEPIVDSIGVSEMPPSLRITAQAGQWSRLEAPADELRSDPDVFRILVGPDPCEPPRLPPCSDQDERWEDVDLIIFLNPEVNAVNIERVTEIVTSWAALAAVDFVSQQAAFEEFQTMFETSDLQSSVTVEDMPPSLRLTAEEGQEAALEATAEALQSDDAIFEIVTQANTLCDP